MLGWREANSVTARDSGSLAPKAPAPICLGSGAQSWGKLRLRSVSLLAR